MDKDNEILKQISEITCSIVTSKDMIKKTTNELNQSLNSEKRLKTEENIEPESSNKSQIGKEKKNETFYQDNSIPALININDFKAETKLSQIREKVGSNNDFILFFNTNEIASINEKEEDLNLTELQEKLIKLNIKGCVKIERKALGRKESEKKEVEDKKLTIQGIKKKEIVKLFEEPLTKCVSKHINFFGKYEKLKFGPDKEVKQIGTGGFGVVNKSKYLNTKIALKTFKISGPNKSKEFFRNFGKEIMMTHRCKGPNSVTLMGIKEERILIKNQNKSQKYVKKDEFVENSSIILNLLQGSPLNDKIGYLKSEYSNPGIYSAKTVLLLYIYVYQLAKGLDFLHRGKIIHRDIKPDNIHVSSSLDITILDFGISRGVKSLAYEMKDSTVTTTKGTVRYMAPENYGEYKSDVEDYMDEREKVTISSAYDVWCYGLVLTELFGLVRPWEGLVDDQVVGCLTNKRPFPIPKSIKNKDIIALIRKCTELDPSLRITMNEVVKIVGGMTIKLFSQLTREGVSTFKTKEDFNILSKVKNIIDELKISLNTGNPPYFSNSSLREEYEYNIFVDSKRRSTVEDKKKLQNQLDYEIFKNSMIINSSRCDCNCVDNYKTSIKLNDLITGSVNSAKRKKQNPKLILQDLIINNSGIQQLVNKRQGLKHITYLDLTSNNLDDNGLKLLNASSSQDIFPNLIYLNLSNNGISDVGAKLINILIFERTTPTLTTLILNGNQITDVGARSLFNIDSNKKATLEVLELSYNNLRDLPCFITTKCNNLKFVTTLDLSYNSIGKIGSNHISKCKNLMQITNLNLEKNLIQGDDCEELVKLKYLVSLEVLNLGLNELGNKGCEVLAKNLKSETITELNLANNKIEGTGFKVLNELLLKTDNLKVLNLSYNDIGNNCCKIIANDWKFKSVTDLNLANNKIGDDGCKDLSKSTLLSDVEELDLTGNGEISYNGTIYLNMSINLKSTNLILDDEITKGIINLIEILNNWRDERDIIKEKKDVIRLDLSDKDLTDNEFIALFKSAGLEDIKILNLSKNNKIKAPSLLEFSHSKYVVSLEELYFSNCNIGYNECKAIATSENLENVKILDLSNNNIGNDGCNALFKLWESKTLKELNLSGNSIGPSCCKGIVSGWFESVEIFNLSNNQIGDDGCEILFRPNKDNLFNFKENKFKQLNLAANKIGSRGCEIIGDNWKFPYNQSEKKEYQLNLSDNQINNQGVKYLLRKKNLFEIMINRKLDLSSNNIDTEFLNKLENLKINENEIENENQEILNFINKYEYNKKDYPKEISEDQIIVCELSFGKNGEKLPLHYFASFGNIEKLRILIKEDRFDVYKKDEGDCDPLYWALYYDQLEAFIELLKLGADPFLNREVFLGTDLLTLARQCNKKEIAKFLKEYEKIKNNFKRTKNLDFLIETNEEILNFANKYEYNKANYPKDVSKEDFDDCPIYYFANIGDIKNIRKFVLENKSDIDKKYNEQTALHRAVETGQLESCLELIRLGANPFISDLWKRTPLDCARDDIFPDDCVTDEEIEDIIKLLEEYEKICLRLNIFK